MEATPSSSDSNGNNDALQFMLEEMRRMRLDMENMRLERDNERRDSSASIAVKMPKPKSYYGARNPLVIDTWLHRMEDYLEMTKTKDEWKTRIAAGYLEGPAFLWYQQAAEQWAMWPYTPWETFKQALKARFIMPNADMKYWMEWNSLKQDRTVAEYITRFNTTRMVLQITDENIAMDRFINGLRWKTQTEVRLRGPTSLEEAMSIADRYDTLMTQQSAIRSAAKGTYGAFQDKGNNHANPWRNDASTWNGSTSYQDDRGTPMELDMLQGNSKPQGNQFYSAKAAKRGTFKGTCNYCGRNGHKRLDCRRLQSDMDSGRLNKTKNHQTQ